MDADSRSITPLGCQQNKLNNPFVSFMYIR